MAVQGKALHNLCRSLWRVNVSGYSGHRHILSGSAPCQLRRWLSSHPQNSARPSTHASCPPLPLCYQSHEISLKAGHHKCLKNDVLPVSSEFMRLTGPGLCPSVTKPRSIPVRGELSVAPLLHQQHLEYVCPSEKLTIRPELPILEKLPQLPSVDLPQNQAIVSLIIDTPITSAEISEPTSNTNTPKEARRIMKIRRKKMKRHLLKKFRKRMAFTLRKIKRDRKKKKMAVFMARLAGIKEWGDSFNARDWMQEELDKARKGGFYINVLERKQ